MILKQRINKILEVSDIKDRSGLLFDFVLYFSILFNISLQIVASFYYQNHESQFIFDFSKVFYTFSIVLYTFELVLRIWTCSENERYASTLTGRLLFLLNPLIIIDIIVILSFVLFGPDVNVIFLRSIRLFNISQYINSKNNYAPYQLLKRSLFNKKEELLITFFGSLITLTIFSFLIYLIERNAQPKIFEDITPSLKWVFGVLTNSETIEFSPVTTSGKILHILMTIVGVLIVGLPLGIITGGFISEIEDAKRNDWLSENANLLIKAFGREGKIPVRTTVDQLQLKHEGRWIDLDNMSARLQFSQNELFEIIRSSKQLRIRACRKSADSIFEDNLIVESFPATQKFGCLILNNSKIHIISTQNYSDPGIGHFSRMIAYTVNANYYSNEFFSSADMIEEKRINFATNPNYYVSSLRSNDPFTSWKKSLTENIKSEDLVLYFGTAGSQSEGDFHILCGGEKGVPSFEMIESPTYKEIDSVRNFYKNLKFHMESIHVSVTDHTRFGNIDNNHCSRALNQLTGANVISIYVNIGLLQFSEGAIYYKMIRILSDHILEHLLTKRP